MRVVDAYWEKRNLGVSTTEVYIDTKDSLDELKNVIKHISSQYIVVKVAYAAVDAMLFLQDMGFRYIETNILLESKISHMQIPPIYKRFLKNYDFVEADPQLTERVLAEVSAGKIFKNDRIALDPFFSAEIAGKRYSNWIKDELERNAVIYIAKYKNVPVTFTVVKPVSETVYNSFLGGVFESEANKGFGFTGSIGIADKVAAMGGKKITTRVSSNNLPILRIHMNLGYEIQAMDSVFVKHQE